MNPLLVIHSSGRVTRSVTRTLAQHAVAAWTRIAPRAPVVERDVGLHPPATVNEPWIAAAYTPPQERSADQHAALAVSETIIGEIESAAAIVVAAPMYNFGMPAQLKAYIDQVVRAGRTFGLTDDPHHPYQPLLASKPVLVLESTSTTTLLPGGPIAHLNFLEPHLQTALGFVGLTDVTFARVADNERAVAGAPASLASAEQIVEAWVIRAAAAQAVEAAA